MKGRRNLRWQEMNKDGVELTKLIQFYETYNRSEGKSFRTVEWYSEVLNQFLDWLKSAGKPINLISIGAMDVREFILFLRDKRWNGKSLSNNTLNNRVRALHAFYSWLAREEYTSENLLAGLKPPKVTQIVIEPLTPEEIQSLFSQINQDTIWYNQWGQVMTDLHFINFRTRGKAAIICFPYQISGRYVNGKGQVLPDAPKGIPLMS